MEIIALANKLNQYLFQLPTDTIIKFSCWKPAKLIVNLSWVNSITAVMSLTVSNMLNETLRLIKLLQNGLYNLNVLSLIVTANIVNLAYIAISDNKINSRTMVLYIKPVTNINTLTIYRQFLIMQSIDNHERNQPSGEEAG